METGSETDEEDKLLVSEEDGLLNGSASPASLANHEPAAPLSPRLGHALMTKIDDEEDEMRDSGVEHVWNENDILRSSVDGTGTVLSFSAPTLCHKPYPFAIEHTPFIFLVTEWQELRLSLVRI